MSVVSLAPVLLCVSSMALVSAVGLSALGGPGAHCHGAEGQSMQRQLCLGRLRAAIAYVSASSVSFVFIFGDSSILLGRALLANPSMGLKFPNETTKAVHSSLHCLPDQTEMPDEVLGFQVELSITGFVIAFCPGFWMGLHWQ